MAKDIIEQVETHIREILRLCGVLDADGGELHKLNDLETPHTACQLEQFRRKNSMYSDRKLDYLKN
jgi:hypothetical protein